MRHRAYDMHRRRRVERLTDELALAEIATSTELTSVAAELAANLSETVLIRAFRRLPENYRLVLLLTEIEQQPPAVTGPILGMSANAASALAYRARLRLRELYRLEDHMARQKSDHLHE
jgi:DNA-directed RNA polymerase specialized sigma24 family protein